ncbi:MAG: peptidoglycan-binding protein [Oscillospiraceae bacterium]|jgi:peptidoglycan hydrolase-like protein with peptidoglycan-binding domain|nr:peptidoglycan-binding protein [Oscillospiraceae bacterium]
MVMVIPYVPTYITVHLGSPSDGAANVTVEFIDYVKNVASSEIYPTWDEAALLANILAIISFALNRVYTEYYRSRGYNFDITSSTGIDQKFINGRSFFDTIERIVDRVFNDYLRRIGFVEPLAAKFCNGTTATCNGLSQWGSQELAQDGLDALQILQYYYGTDVEIVLNAPMLAYTPSYPGTPFQLGSQGEQVVFIQAMLNRIAVNYPALPKIDPVDGIFGQQTEAAVMAFQRVFSLTADGIVGKSTWYQLVRLYMAVTKLGELESQGHAFSGYSWQLTEPMVVGARGESVRILQYMLVTLSRYIPNVAPITIDGIFGQNTRAAVIAFQRFAGIPDDGVVNARTWQLIYDRYAGIQYNVVHQTRTFTPPHAVETPENIREVQRLLRDRLGPVNPRLANVAVTGQLDEATRNALRVVQELSGLEVTGELTPETVAAIVVAVDQLIFTNNSYLAQAATQTLREGDTDFGGGTPTWL